MSLLDIFKKKSAKQTSESSTSLDDLPPIPHAVQSQELNLPSQPGSSTPTLPPNQGSDPFPESTLDPNATPSSLDEDALNPSSTTDSGLEIPLETDVSIDPLEPVDALPDVDIPEGLQEEQPALAEPLEENKDPMEATEPMQSIQDSREDKPEQEDIVMKEESQPYVADISTDDMSVHIKETEDVEDLQESDETLPSFQDLQDDISMQRSGEQLATDSSSSVDIKTESLLLKSIFVEKEHYANLLFSLKRTKDDLEKSGPQQRKLAHVDMRLAKEYNKLSTLLENTNENLMVIEHIVSNEQF